MTTKIYVPSMHGPWYTGTWHEVEEIITPTSYKLYYIKNGEKQLIMWDER